MRILRKLVAVVTLAFVLSLSAFGGETSTPPCDPGETHGPPCPSLSTSTPGEISTPPAAAAGQTDTPPSGELSLTEIASSVLFSIMSLF